MATTEIVMLDRTMAYTIDEADPTNVLTESGFHLLDVRRKIENYDSTEGTGYTMSVVIDADEILALKFLEDSGGYALFRVYSGESPDEAFEGYLAVKDADGKVCSLGGDIYLGVATAAKTDFITAIIAYLSDSEKAAEFVDADDPEVLTDAITTAASKIRFTVEE